MALYLQLAAYDAEGAREVIEKGLVARRSAIERMASVLGGSVIGYYAVTNGEWNVAALVDLPDAMSHADLGRLEMMQTASGRAARLSLLPLAMPEEFDSASRLAEESYVPPGRT